mgnify:CR=1 FL=1
MNKTNYNKMSEQTTKPYSKPTITAIPAEEIKQDITEQHLSNKPTDDRTNATTDYAKQVIDNQSVVALKGTVVNCTKLNVRKNPYTTADIAAVIQKGDEVSIDTTFEHDDFYKIRYGVIKGYCMKDYIEYIEKAE